MISPRFSLIAATAALAVPLCATASLAPQFAYVCLGSLAFLALVCAADALAARGSLSRVNVTSPPFLKWFKARPAELFVSAGANGLEVAIDLPAGLELHGESARRPSVVADGRAKFACLPAERGRYEVTLCHLRASSPLGLWHIRKPKEIKTAIRVFPDLEREPGAKWLMMKKPGGQRVQRTIGRGRDFERLRDYTPGDSYDEIAWKASARRGRPIVRVFQAERTQDVYAVIDCSRLGARGGAVEQFVGAALMLALAAENNDDKFGLIAFSDRVDRFVAPGRGKLHFARCRDAVFDLKASRVSPDFAELFSFLQLRVRRRSLLLFLTDLADPMLAESFLRHVHLLSRRHVVLVNRLGDREVRPLFSGAQPANDEEIALRLAGHLQWATLKDLERSLGRLGVGASVLTPGSAGADLVSRYNDVKRRQSL